MSPASSSRNPRRRRTGPATRRPVGRSRLGGCGIAVGATRGLGCTLVLLAGLWGVRVPAAVAQEEPSGETVSSLSANGGLPAEMPLTRSVERDLLQLQEQWTQWMGAFYQVKPELSETLVTGLVQGAGQLGLRRLPDFSVSASTSAVQAAIEEGDFARADWALQAAERFDPGRAETSLARARVRWRQGRHLSALWNELAGVARIFDASPGRELAEANLLLWLLYALIAAAGLYIVLQMAVKGPQLFADLEAMVGGSGNLPVWVRRLLVVVLLLWPLALPGNLLWLLLYWSALLFTSGSLAERAVFVLCWLLLVMAPLGVSYERREVDLALSPAMRGLDAVAEGRLYGQLFQDLEQLSSLLPDDPAVIQLMADVHRGLGQWDTALELYQRVVEVEADNAWVLIDIGGYYFFKGDYGNARSYYQRATEVDPGNVVAFYNLSQAFSQDNFLFNEAQAALQQAQAIDAGKVSQLQRDTGQQRVATPNGGVERAPVIRAHLAKRFHRTEAGATAGEEAAAEQRGAPRVSAALPLGQVSGVLGAAAVAILFSLIRPRTAPVPAPADRRSNLRDAFVPGLASVRSGRGGRAFGALLIPVALVTLPMIDHLAYPLFAVYGSTGPALGTVAAAGLLLFFGVRLALARLG